MINNQIKSTVQIHTVWINRYLTMNRAITLNTYSNSFNHSISQRVTHAASLVNAQCESHFIQILKSLSKQNKWIFITANTTMPTCDTLLAHGVELNRLVRLRPSHHLSETETIEKAKQFGTASAIICNSNCYYFSDSQWLTLNRKIAVLH